MDHDEAAEPDLKDFESYLLVLAQRQAGDDSGRVDPRDIVQHTLATAHEKLGQFRGSTTSELAGWLRSILVNHLRDTWRKKGREIDEQALVDQLALSSLRLAELMAADQQSPSQHAVTIEQLQQLADALMALPADQRQAIELRHLGGLSLAQIAERMNRSKPAVGGLLQRGLKALRHTMKQ